MRNKILSDIKTAARLFKQVRQAGKEGVEVCIRKAGPLTPLIMPETTFIHTMEGHAVVNCDKSVYAAAAEAFKKLPLEERHRLASPPEDGEYIRRARFWKGLFSTAMRPEQARAAMIAVLHWYIHIKAMERQWDRPVVQYLGQSRATGLKGGAV